jgi:glucose/mannose-6-phosphate isomerase
MATFEPGDDDSGDLSGGVPDDLSELFAERTPDAWVEPDRYAAEAEDDLGSPASDLDDVVAVLDNPQLVHARDPGRLLWALATAGAQVRRAVAAGAEYPHSAADGPAPRAVLVVTDASASVTGAVLAHLGGGQAAVLDWRTSELPRWAGPADALLAASTDGRHPRVAMLLAEADRRGMSVVAVSPEDSPVAAAAGRGTRVPIEPPAHRRAALWSILTPLLIAARELGAVTVTDDELIDVADSLDAVAAACRPDTDAFGNAAKQLAVEVSETDLLVAGCGPLSALAGRWLVDSLALMAGIGAVALALPDDVAEAGALLEIPPSGPASATSDDFYRDRAEVPARRRRLLILPEYGVLSAREEGPPGRLTAGPALVRPSDGSELFDIAASRAAGMLDDIASARGITSSRPELPGRSPLARFAAATAFGDFTAAYTGIGRGVDPGAVRAGEMPF